MSPRMPFARYASPTRRNVNRRGSAPSPPALLSSAGHSATTAPGLPLWFGNQAAPACHNPVLGTARVLRAYAEVAPSAPEARRAVDYLLHAQHAQGGWGGDAGVPPSVEESALVIIALRHWRELPNVESAWLRGLDYLISRVEDGSWSTPSPIGLYFASLWYSEELYPIIWTVEALGAGK